MNLYDELEKFSFVNLQELNNSEQVLFTENFDGLLKQIKNFTKQQLKTVQQVEFLKDDITKKMNYDIKLFDETLNVKNSLERQRKVLFSGLMNIVDLISNFYHMVNQSQDLHVKATLETLYKEVQKNLRNIGFISIDKVGEDFDSTYHYTVKTKWVEQQNEDTVLEVLRIGYIFEGEVIRKADVIVNSKGGN